MLVNGVERPFHKVSATRYRLRILNAANFQFFNLQLGDGAKLVQIATESGLMPRPVKRRQALIGPAERVELIVDFSRFAGKRVVLRSVGQDAPFKSLGSKTFDGPLMEFRVGKKRPRHDLGARRAAPAARLGGGGVEDPAAHVGGDDQQRAASGLADQRQDLRPGGGGHHRAARLDRHLGAEQPDRRRRT